MQTAEMKQVEAALAMVRDSEILLINLKLSISSNSSSCDHGISGLSPYLKATKRTMRVQLINFAIRALWRLISRKLRVGN